MRSYIDLLGQYQPRPVTSEHQAQEYQDVIDSLIDSPERLTEDELEFMALLGELISGWEDGNFSLPEISGVELVRHLLQANSLRQKDLVGPVFPSEGIASEVLLGKRRLTLPFIECLGKFFHLPPAAFLLGTIQLHRCTRCLPLVRGNLLLVLQREANIIQPIEQAMAAEGVHLETTREPVVIRHHARF